MDTQLPADETTPEPGRPDAEAVYRWTIRTLYALAIGLNLWVLWDAVKDSPEFEIRRREWGQRAQRLVAPVRAQRVWQASVNRMHRQAQWALVEGEEAPHDGD